MCLKILGFFILIVLKASKSEEDGKSSLVFVFDTTGSMYNDLKQLREGAEMILKTALDEGNVIGDFVFVPFHDPSVGPATVTQDKEVFKSALEKVHVYGGGDCPEKSLSGIKLALDVSKEKSYVYVFTDATAGDHRLVGKVLDGVQRKQSQVVFVLTGHCNDLDKPSFKVYQQIAAASSGQVFNLNKTSVHKVLDFVKSSIKGRMVNLGSSVKPAGSNYTQEIPVDSSLGEVTVSVSGAKPQITVVDPKGEQLTGPPKLITTLDLAEIMVVKVMDPEPGNWSITVGSDEDFSVKVSGLSNLTFEHGFSVEQPTSLAETSYRPLKGTYNHMMIGLSQKDAPVTIDFAEVLSLNGSTLFELPLQKVDPESQVYLAKAFIPPDDFFCIAINGRDEHSQSIRRIGTTAVQSKVPDVPYLTTPNKISAYAHSRVVLKCKVESMVPLTAMWTKDSHKLQPQTTSIQTSTIEYVIEDVKEEDVGTYKCLAKNVAGASKGVTKLSIIVEPPQVSIEPANKTIRAGDNITITCTVITEALLLDFHFKSTSEKGTKISVEPNIEGIYTFNKTIHNADEKDAGVYTCLATNKGGSTNQSTTIAIQRHPTAQILGPHTISTTSHTTQIICQVNHSDVLKWVHNELVVKEVFVNGSRTDILELNVTDGTWICVAERGKFEASDAVDVTYVMKPSVSIAGKNITIVNGTVFALECKVLAKPYPRMVWHRETEEFLNHTITELQPNVYKSVLTLNSSKENVEATYFCYGENSEGLSHDHIQVNVRRKMSVVKSIRDISENLYNTVELNCLVDSHPSPQTTWRHNKTIILPTKNRQIINNNTTLSIKRLDFDDLGVYTCEAENEYEKVELNATLSIQGLETPTVTKEPAEITVVKGKSTIITCRILKGIPTPSIAWEFKRSTADNFATLNTTDSEVNVTATEDNQGTYRCVAENVVGRDTYDVQLILNYPPQLNKISLENVTNMKIEAGDKIILLCDVIGVPPPIVFWTKNKLPMTFSKNVHLEGDNLVIENATEYDSGNFVCNAKNSLGNVQKNFTVLVYEKPEITSKDTHFDILEGELVELPCEAKGSPKPIISWKHDDVLVTDERKFVDEFGIRFVANLTDFGNYTCQAENQYGNDSVTYSLYVWVPPSIKGNKETNIDALVGDDVSLQCDAVGFPIPTIEWLFQFDRLTENTTDLSFNDVGNLNITNVNIKHEGTYMCVAQNFKGFDNKLFHVNVNEPPKILDDNYTGPYLATNLDTALTVACEAAGKPKPYVIWSKDGVYLNKGRDGTLTIKNPSEDMSGNYTCIAKNKFGTVNKTITVEVYSLPIREQSEESLSKATVLEHSDSQLDCPVRSSNGDTVQWYKDAELISTGHLTLTNVTRHSEATYACVVTNAVGSAYSTVALNVEWPPEFIKYDDDVQTNIENTYYNSMIEGEKGEKEAETKIDDTKVTQLKDAAKNDTNENKSNGTHTPINIDDAKANLTEYNVDEEKQSNDTTKENTDEDIGAVIDKRNGIKQIDEFKPKIANDVVHNEVIVVEVVKGDDTYLDCQTDAKPPAKIKWLHNSNSLLFEDKPRLRLVNAQPRNEGNYKCIATNAHGSVHRLFQVHVSVPPFISEFDVLDVTLMAGMDATLDCEARGPPLPSIVWTFNNTNWHIQNSSLTTNTTLSSEGSFRCDARNKAGSAHIVYRVEVVAPGEVDDIVAFGNGEGISIDRSYEVALDAHIRIACKATGKPTPKIQWLRNGKVLGENDQDINYADLILDVEKSHTGFYSCVVVNIGGSGERTIKLEVLEPPKIIQSIFQTAPTLEVLSGQSYYLHCHPIGNPLPEIYWFKDGLPLKFFDDTMVSIDYGETIYVKSAVVEQIGNYTCVARNRAGNDSVSYYVDVLVPPPKPKELSMTVSVRAGKALSLTCPIDGAPTPFVTWIKHPYTEVEGSNRIALLHDNTTLLINHTQVSDSGNYSCIMMNKAGTTEVVFSVTIVKTPSIAGNVSMETHTVALWRSVVLKCEADGHPLPSINWLKDTQKLSDSLSNVHRVLGNSLLALWRVTSHDAGQYICVVENEAGTTHRRYNVVVSVPGKWSVWGQWSLCNATCGIGQQLRSRSCNYIDEDNNIIDKNTKPDKIAVDESACKGSSHERRKCQMPPCEEEGTGVWLPWSRWQPCSVTCGTGTQARTRKCKDRLCEGDNVQIRKCTDLPKCSSTEENSENDVYSREGSKENAYIPQAVFENQPELLNSLYSPDVEEFYTVAGSKPSEVYDVNVTSNLDGSDAGHCSPGFKPSGEDGACNDIDECELDNNHCHSTQVCRNSVGGYRCSCTEGYTSLGVGQRCMDINECSQDTSGCEYACVNTAGGYVCACPAHTRLHADKHHCYTVSSNRMSYEALDTSELLSASVEHPARYKHIRNA